MQPAIVHWFDASSGEGMVETADGEHLYLHFTCIEGIDRNGYAWPAPDDQSALEGIAGRPCMITVYRNLYSARVDRCLLGA